MEYKETSSINRTHPHASREALSISFFFPLITEICKHKDLPTEPFHWLKSVSRKRWGGAEKPAVGVPESSRSKPPLAQRRKHNDGQKRLQWTRVILIISSMAKLEGAWLQCSFRRPSVSSSWLYRVSLLGCSAVLCQLTMREP